MAKPVEENYLITIKGTMEQNGENDTVELMTRGNFVQRGNSYYIVYAETEATGYAGCTTTVRVSQDARLVSMTRFGKTSSQLSIEKGIPQPRANVFQERGRCWGILPSGGAVLGIVPGHGGHRHRQDLRQPVLDGGDDLEEMKSGLSSQKGITMLRQHRTIPA